MKAHEMEKLQKARCGTEFEVSFVRRNMLRFALRAATTRATSLSASRMATDRLGAQPPESHSNIALRAKTKTGFALGRFAVWAGMALTC